MPTIIETPHRLSLDRIERAARVIDPLFRDSPQFDCEPLRPSRWARIHTASTADPPLA